MFRSMTMLLVMFASLAGFAQETSTTESTTLEGVTNETSPANQEVAPIPDKKVERVQVTGSHIKRIDLSGPSPVQVITRKTLDQSGYNGVADVLRETTVNSFGSMREDSGSNASGAAHVNLRGLGSGNTLVLVNGIRVPTDAVTGAVDLNLIPMAAVERIEVLKDGASAIYGSDALGGVVNIITRKDFTDSQIDLMRVQPEQKGGTKQEISIVNGVNGKRGNMVNVVHYRTNEIIWSRDRDWSKTTESPTGSPGSYKSPTGTWQPDPTCPAGQVKPSGAGSICTFNPSNYASELPALQQFSLFSETNYELSSRVRVKGRVMGSQRKTQWSFAPSPGVFTISAQKAATSGPGGTQLPGSVPGEPLTVRYRTLELGTRDTETQAYSYGLGLGSTVDIGKGWEFEAYTGFNGVHNDDKGVRGYALKADIEKAIEDGTFRPFSDDRGSIEHTRYVPTEKMLSLLSTADAKVSGELAQFESGPLGLAMGTGITFQRFEDKADDLTVNGQVFGSAGSKGEGQRNTTALFSELSVPVTSKLELQLAARYDNYSDFGSSTNPKVALAYRPAEELLLRASAGTGFKAPQMQDMYRAESRGAEVIMDPKACEMERAAGIPEPSSCEALQYDVVSGGNIGLKEERSVSYNIGAVYQPTKNFSFGSDLFLTKQTNVVGISYQSMLNAEASGVDVSKYGVTIARDDQGYITEIHAPVQNLSSQEVYGIDIEADYRFSKFKLSSEHAHIFYFKQEGFPGSGYRDIIGTNGAPAWRNTTGISYLPNDYHDVNVSAQTVAEHEKGDPTMGKLGQFTSFDLAYSYNSRSWGSITAGVKNVFAANAPLDEGNPTNQLDGDLYDPIGRQVFAGYKTTF
jgi:iron complex outermembrane recepter protein